MTFHSPSNWLLENKEGGGGAGQVCFLRGGVEHHGLCLCHFYSEMSDRLFQSSLFQARFNHDHFTTFIIIVLTKSRTPLDFFFSIFKMIKKIARAQNIIVFQYQNKYHRRAH